MANRQSNEERCLLHNYHARQCNKAIVGFDTQTLEQWAQEYFRYYVRYPAPLIRWYETEYPKYLARKAKRAS